MTVDPKKIPSRATLEKILPEGYALEAVRFRDVRGRVEKKGSELRFVPAGSQASYRMERGEFDEKPAEHPLDALTRQVDGGVAQFVVSGALDEERRDGKTVLRLAVTAAKAADGNR